MTTCSGPDCSRRVRADGLCDTHYRQARKGSPLTPIPVRKPYNFKAEPGACIGPNCNRPVRFAAVCDSHYRQLKAGKDLTEIRPYVKRPEARVFLREAALAFAQARGEYQIQTAERLLHRAALAWSRTPLLARAASTEGVAA